MSVKLPLRRSLIYGLDKNRRIGAVQYGWPLPHPLQPKK